LSRTYCTIKNIKIEYQNQQKSYACVPLNLWTTSVIVRHFSSLSFFYWIFKNKNTCGLQNVNSLFCFWYPREKLCKMLRLNFLQHSMLELFMGFQIPWNYENQEGIEKQSEKTDGTGKVYRSYKIWKNSD